MQSLGVDVHLADVSGCDLDLPVTSLASKAEENDLITSPIRVSMSVGSLCSWRRPASVEGQHPEVGEQSLHQLHLVDDVGRLSGSWSPSSTASISPRITVSGVRNS